MLYSSKRWMVFASWPVASLIRFAALPVGAASNNLTPILTKIFRMALTMVVFPVPGPPVMIKTLSVTARLTASICLDAKVVSNYFCTHLSALSGSIGLMDFGALVKAFNRRAILVLSLIHI